MGTLDNQISTPLYQQLAEKLREEIESDQRQAGSRLPTELELSEQYGVSRVTVRKALGTLEQKGYLVRKSGKGTFVRENKLQRRLSSVIGYSDMCEKLGYKPGAKTIKIGLEEPSAEDAEHLGITVNEKVVVLERIRYANGKPTLIETSKFTEEFFFLFEEDLNDASLYETIRERKGIQFTESVKLLEIIFANYQESRYLNVEVGYPLLQIESVVGDSSGKYRQISRQLCIADKFKLIV